MMVIESPFDAIVHAISLNDDAVQQFLEDKDISQAVSALSKVLRTCQKILGLPKDSHAAGGSSRRPVLSSRVIKILDRYMTSSPARACGIGQKSSSKKKQVEVQAPQEEPGVISPRHEDHRRTRESSDDTASCILLESSVKTTIDQETSCDYVYDKPITFPSKKFDHKSIERSPGGISNVCMALSCAATFNLALFHHMAARDIMIVLDRHHHANSGGDEGEDVDTRAVLLLGKAARLYEICLALPANADFRDFEGPCLFNLAAVNNLGIVFGQLGKHDSMKECFTSALTAIIFLIDRRYHDPRSRSSRRPTRFLDSDDIDGFLRNVSCIVYMVSNVAVAA